MILRTKLCDDDKDDALLTYTEDPTNPGYCQHTILIISLHPSSLQ